MKKIIITSLLSIILWVFYSSTIFAQARLSSTDGPVDMDPSAAFEIDSDHLGVLMPTVTLSYDEGEIVALTIPAPADGLMIFHGGSNSISKGLWYYDASVPRWVIYSDYTSVLAYRDLENFGEMFESKEIGNGTAYALSDEYATPWVSAEVGLNGDAFTFKDDIIVNTETGTAVADQYHISDPHAIYTVHISATILSSTPNNVVTGTLYINDMIVPNLFFRHTFQLKNYPTNCNTKGFLELDAGDRVDFRFISDDKNNGIEVEHLNVRFFKLADL